MKVLVAALLAVLAVPVSAQERVEISDWASYVHPRTHACVVDVRREMNGGNWAFVISKEIEGSPRLSLWNGVMGPAAMAVDLAIDDRRFPIDLFKGRDSEFADGQFEQDDVYNQFEEALAAGSTLSVIENGQTLAAFSLSGSRQILEAHNICRMGQWESLPEG